jgi:hypothetical protein
MMDQQSYLTPDERELLTALGTSVAGILRAQLVLVDGTEFGTEAGPGISRIVDRIEELTREVAE